MDFTFFTFAGTGAVPTLTLNNSSVLIGATFVSVTDPTAISNKFMLSFTFVVFSGSVSGFPIIEPINESLLEREGSSFVPIATKPPGLTESTKPAPVPNETISVCMD